LTFSFDIFCHRFEAGHRLVRKNQLDPISPGRCDDGSAYLKHALADRQPEMA
jgi:hypothetical protein